MTDPPPLTRRSRWLLTAWVLALAVAGLSLLVGALYFLDSSPVSAWVFLAAATLLYVAILKSYPGKAPR